MTFNERARFGLPFQGGIVGRFDPRALPAAKVGLAPLGRLALLSLTPCFSKVRPWATHLCQRLQPFIRGFGNSSFFRH
jgi:hypothetical protein